MDFIDEGQEREAFFLDLLIAKRKPVQPHTGRCFNCEEPLPNQAAYCDDDCRHDHEARERQRVISGR